MAADKEIMKALDRLRLDRAGRVLGPAMSAAPTIGNIVIAGLSALAATYREEAELWSRSGAKGWKSAEAEAYVIATAIDGVAAQLDNAGGDQPQHEPLPRQFADTTHERLDDFVASAVAAGKGALHPVERHVADVRQEDVTAYLKGEIDTMPGLADALVPSSVHDMATPSEHIEPLATERVAEIFGVPLSLVGEQAPVMVGAAAFIAEAQQMRAPGPMSAAPYCSDCDHDTHRCGGCGEPLAHDESICAACKILHAEPVTDLGPVAMPSTWESPTMTADGHRPPGVSQAPTLGQPGDMGTGYSHTYIPAGGRQFTFADLLTPVPAASLPPHMSHSQGNTIGDCGTKYRLQRVEQVPQIPQWANIGGTAFHACVEHLERMVAANPALSLDGIDVELTWKFHFGQTIEAVAATTTVPVSVWRAARKGAEGEQWWRVNGPLMLRRYLDARPDDQSITIDSGGTPAIEWEIIADVPTPYGPLPFVAKLDRVTAQRSFEVGPNSRMENTIVIRDYKTSYERPTDTTQLGDYAHALMLAGANLHGATRILGSYFDARRGEWTEPVDLLTAHPFEAFQYNVTSRHAQKLALTTGPTPARPSSYCGGCSVRYACPIMATKT